MTHPREPLQQPLSWELKSMAKHLVENSLKRACKQGFWCKNAEIPYQNTVKLLWIMQLIPPELFDAIILKCLRQIIPWQLFEVLLTKLILLFGPNGAM